MPFDASTNVNLGASWLVTQAPDGGLDLRVNPRGRGWVVAGAAALALAWIASSLYTLAAGRPLPLHATPAMAIGIGLLLTAVALWCAFGKEGWYVASNCLEHRVGIGSWRHVRRYRDATLEIVACYNRYGKPYYRLYADLERQRHFLLERRLPELSAWVDLVTGQTGWRRRDTA
jgi:hypothetical protein